MLYMRYIFSSSFFDGCVHNKDVYIINVCRIKVI